MERRHLVVLYGQQVGVIYQRGDHTTFAFDEGYWRRADRPVLGLNFEIILRHRGYHPGFRTSCRKGGFGTG